MVLEGWMLAAAMAGGALLLLLLLILVILLVRRRRRRRRGAAPKIRRWDLFFPEEGSEFPYRKLGNKLIYRLSKRGLCSLNSNFFWNRTKSNAEAQQRGEEFEIMVWNTIQNHRRGNERILPDIRREVQIGLDSRADFILGWAVSKSQWLRAIVECKHSYCYSSRKDQLEKGKEQLLRYKERYPDANLLILLTDFRIPDHPWPFRIDEKILIVNYFLFSDVLDLVNKFIRKRQKKVPKEELPEEGDGLENRENGG